jgi:hypothetical protein
MARFNIFRLTRKTAPKTQTTVEKGTLFEMLTLNTFSQLGMKLQRKGGAGDGGIDLEGKWKIPRSNIIPFSMIIQCKCEAKKLGPNYLRELEGSLSRVPKSSLGMLVSSQG